MFQECSSITEMGRLRINNPSVRLVTAIRMDCIVEFDDYNVLFLIPNYSHPAIRLIFELLDGLRLDAECKYALLFEDALKRINAYNNLEIDSSEFKPELDAIYSLRNKGLEYDDCILDNDIFQSVTRFVAGLGGITLTEPYIRDSKFTKPMQPLASLSHVLDLCYNKENFLRHYNQLSGAFNYCSIGDRVIYLEDMYAAQHITLKSIQRHTNGLYSEYISFADFLKEADLRDDQRELFQQTVCTCGGELILRRGETGYTTLSCVNLHCKNKILWSIVALAKDLGILGLGAGSLSGAVENLWITRVMMYGESKISYTDILTEEFTYYLDGRTLELFNRLLDRIRTFNGLTKELVKYSGLPYVGEYAANIISRDSLERITNFHAMLQVCKGSKIKNLRVAYSLYMYLGDLDHLINMSGCKDCSGVTEFKICITRSVNLKIPGKAPKKFYNKQEFVDFLNMYIEEAGISDLVRVVRKTSMSSKVHVLVNDSGIHSTKVATAQNLGIRVVTSYEVFDCLREVAKSNGSI